MDADYPRKWVIIACRFTIASLEFREALQYKFYRLYSELPSEKSLTEAISLAKARALFDGPEHPVYIRVAGHGGCIYLDLANERGEVVEITPEGWGIISSPPVHFRRIEGMLPLPPPIGGGDINELRRFVNVPDDSSWILLVGWLLKAIHPSGPYPILRLDGEQDSAKTTTTTVLRNLIDPNEAPSVGMPDSTNDLMLMTYNSWIAAFDNFSGISKWMSDALCLIATHGKYRKRKRYKDSAEILWNVMRPVILNGIDVSSSRGDFLSRTISIYLPPIDNAARRVETDFWAEYDTARPQILGALLDIVSTALAHERDVVVAHAPRLIDCARWVTAAAPALGWTDEAFLTAYSENANALKDEPLEDSLLTDPIERLLANQPQWMGTPAECLRILARLAGPNVTSKREWPANASRLGVQIRRISRLLRERRRIDVRVDHSGDRKIVFRRLPASQTMEIPAVDAVDTEPAEAQ